MLDVLTIVQDVRKAMNLSVPTALFGSTDPDERQMLTLLDEVAAELRQAKCWTQQKRKHTFTTTSGRATYPLPKDFYSFVPRSQWNTDETIRLIGPQDDDEFGAKIYGTEPSSVNFSYRIFGWDENDYTGGGQFEISPTPTSEIDLAYEYLTRNLYLPKWWTPSQLYTAPDYVSVSGNVYVCDTNGLSGATPPSGTGSNITDNTTRWDYYDAAWETIKADTNRCIFDSDLVKLGLKAAWKRENGGDWQADRAEFERRIAKAQARYRGPFIGSLCGPKDKGPRYTIPYRSWSL